MPDRPLGGVVWCGRGTGCGCAALLLSSTHPLGCWKDGGGVVWLVWFGMLLGFEATSLLAWLAACCWSLMRCCACWGLVVVAGWGLQGVLGVSVFVLCLPWACLGGDGLWFSSFGVGVAGCCCGCVCGGAGLLFGNCIVNASILQMR